METSTRQALRLSFYFGAVFADVGVVAPFWPVFLKARGLSAPEILVHACSQCHHDGLNQEVSRATFQIGSAAELRTTLGILTWVTNNTRLTACILSRIE